MVKTPKTRHSRQPRQPVTIELEPGAVSRVESGPAADEPAPEDAEPETMRAKEGGLESRQHDEETVAEADADLSGSASAEDAQQRQTSSFDEAPARAEAGENREDGADDRKTDSASRSGEHIQAPPVRNGVAGRIGAGIVGGLVALLGAGALQYGGLLGAPGGGGTDFGSQIAALKGEVAALKNGGDNGAGTRIDGLSAALDQVKADVVSLKAAVASTQPDDSAGLAALGSKVAEIEKAMATFNTRGNAPAVDLGPVNEKLEALTAELKSAGDAAGERQSKLAALEQSVSQLSAKVDAQASQPKIALAIAASALKSALDRGAPFAAELDTFAAIVPDAPQLSALRAYAEKGVPTRAAIAGEVGAAASAMVAAARPADPNAGIFQRLMSSAESLVEVRPVGAVEGKGVPETVARMEVAVNQDDYARALAEYDSLPDAAKTAGADFAAMLKARLDVEAQLDALISGAMKG